MTMTIEDIRNQLSVDVEATDSFLLAALARGDTKAVSIWQVTLAAAKSALTAVIAYEKVLAQ